MAKSTPPKIVRPDVSDCKQSYIIMRALVHPIRIQFLKTMDSHKKKQCTVTHFYTTCNLPQSEASRHLKLLREAGLVKCEKNGHQRLYSVDYDKIGAINNFLRLYKLS